jgi:hypothetical protein
MQYLVLLLVAALLATGGIASCEHKEKVAIQTTYDSFVTKVNTLGKEAAEEAKNKEETDKRIQVKANDDRKKLLADNAILVKRLSSNNSRRSAVSAPSPLAGSPDRISFDSAKFAGAVRSFDEGLKRYEEGVFGIATEGSKAVIDLDSAKGWATSLKLSQTLKVP